MKKFKVAQKCAEEIERLRKLEKADEQAALKHEEAVAVAAAVEKTGGRGGCACPRIVYWLGSLCRGVGLRGGSSRIMQRLLER